MGSSLLSLLKFAIGWPLSALALFFVGKIIVSNAKTVAININEINLLLLFSGVFCFLLYYFIRALTWKIILKEQGYDIPLKTASFLWGVAELRRFVPGKFWSYLSRATLFSSINIPKKTTIKALVVETESFLLAGFIISILGAIFYSNSLLPQEAYSLLVPIFLFLILATILFINGSVIVQRLSNYSSSEVPLSGTESRSLHRDSSRPFDKLRARTIKFLINLFPQFPPKRNAIILLVSIFYLFLFGFGTYLTVASITFVSPEFFLEISVFFVFALLVGYLSIITPMGLGVRESVIIVGLSQFVSLSTAGVVSIFARVVVIISDLLFLLFTFLWKRTKNKLVNSFENFVVVHKHEVILGVFVIIYIVYFTVTTFLRYDNYYTGRFDLGNMDQTVWNTIHGRIFELTDPNGTEIVSRLAFHADFILILLAPFYLIWEHPKMLLLIQTITLAFGAIFVYLIGKGVLKNKNLSLAFAAAFLLNPAVQYTNLYDFHPVTLATTFLLGAFYFLLNKKYLWFLLFAVLAAITKEQVWVIIAIFGLYVFFSKSVRHSGEVDASTDSRINPHPNPLPKGEGRGEGGQARMTTMKVFGLIITFVSVLIFYLLIWHAIPNALGSEHFALSYYSDFGDSPAQIVKNFFLEPQKIITTILQKNQLYYLLQLSLPLGFTSLLSPFLLIFTIPDLFINLLSNKSQLHQIYYQYSATITPFIFVSAIFGIKNLKVWFPKLSYVFVTCYLLIVTCYSAYAFGPLPFSKSPNIDMFTKPQKNKDVIENFIFNIPSKYSVAATNSVGSHLTHRQKIFNLPVGIDKADFIVFLLDDHFAQPSLSEQEKMLEKVEKDKNYVEVLRIDNFIVFKKRVLVK